MVALANRSIRYSTTELALPRARRHVHLLVLDFRDVLSNSRARGACHALWEPKPGGFRFPHAYVRPGGRYA